MSAATNRRTARGNRLGLLVVGLVLLVAGLAALARGLEFAPGLLGSGQVEVLDEQVRQVATRGWFWPVVVAGLLVVALLALRWLAVQVRSDAIRELRLEADASRGSTTLPARVVTAALVEDVAASAGSRRAQAVLTGRTDRPRLELSVTLPPDADLAATRYGLRRALGRHRRALEADELPATVLLR